MYEKISRYAADQFESYGFISCEEKEIFAFSFERIFSSVVLFIMLLLLGVWQHSILESLLYFFIFFYARKYAGGYHATTHLNCGICYLITYLIILFFSRISFSVQNDAMFFSIGSIFVFCTTIIFAPINNPNNPILPGKENRFFICAIAMNSIFLLLCFVLKAWDFDLWHFILAILCATSLFMHVEIVRRREWGFKIIHQVWKEKISKLRSK